MPVGVLFRHSWLCILILYGFSSLVILNLRLTHSFSSNPDSFHTTTKFETIRYYDNWLYSDAPLLVQKTSTVLSEVNI